MDDKPARVTPELRKLRLAIANRVRGVMIDQEWTIEELAEHLDTPVRTLQSWMQGKPIDGRSILRLITLTETRPAWLLKGTGPMYEPRPHFSVGRQPNVPDEHADGEPEDQVQNGKPPKPLRQRPRDRAV